jgi:hypothetical protein
MEQITVYSAQLPGEGKLNKNGEDAILITKCKKCLGVFDGSFFQFPLFTL